MGVETLDPAQRIEAVRADLPPSLRKVADFVLESARVRRGVLRPPSSRAGPAPRRPPSRGSARPSVWDGYLGLVRWMGREQGRKDARRVRLGVRPRSVRRSPPTTTSTASPRSSPPPTSAACRTRPAASTSRPWEVRRRRFARAHRVDGVRPVGGSAAMAAETTDSRLFGISVVPVRNWTVVHAASTSAALLPPPTSPSRSRSPGATREVVEPTELAARRGATTIAVTGDPTSALAQIADVVLTVAPGGHDLREGPFAAGTPSSSSSTASTPGSRS